MSALHVTNHLSVAKVTTQFFAQEDSFCGDRLKMVDEQIVKRGICNSALLNVLRKTPRHLFVPDDLLAEAYRDTPLPIGEGQTISQPYMVALMTESLDLFSGCKVLEVGTGSGYQTTVLAQLADAVYSIEINSRLLAAARKRFEHFGLRNIFARLGDGWRGWVEEAPFDRIIVTAAPDEVPQDLLAQMSEFGKMVIPVGPAGNQKLYVISKKQGKIIRAEVSQVSFVPLIKQNH